MGRFNQNNVETFVVEEKKDVSNDFKLLASLVRFQKNSSEAFAQYTELAQLLNGTFTEIFKHYSIPELYTYEKKLQNFLHELRTFVDFPYLANKNVVAVGGAFSSGKSRFLNSIMGEFVLPMANTPTTAVPTFVTKGSVLKVSTFNAFNNVQEISVADLERMSHAIEEDCATVELATILQKIQVQTPNIPWKNLALLDTPGYSKTDEKKGNGIDDNQIAKQQIDGADHLIWVVGASDGTIVSSDIAFLQECSIAKDSNKFVHILINRADERKGDIEKIMQQVQKDLDKAGIRVHDISAYSALETKVYLGNNPRFWLDDIDRNAKFVDWQSRFKALWAELKNEVKKESAVYSSVQRNLRPLIMKSETSNEQFVCLNQSLVCISTRKEVGEMALKKLDESGLQAEKLLVHLLQILEVKDKESTHSGPIAILNDLDNTYSNLNIGNTLTGNVVKVDPFGVYVSASQVANKLIRISHNEIDRYYTDDRKDELWAEGVEVKLAVSAVCSGTIEFSVELV